MSCPYCLMQRYNAAKSKGNSAEAHKLARELSRVCNALKNPPKGGGICRCKS